MGKERSRGGWLRTKTRGKKYQLSGLTGVREPTRRRFPIPMQIVGADEYMELSVR